MPEIIDPVFVKTSPKRSFTMTEYEHVGLVFTNTRVYKFGQWSLLFGNQYISARKIFFSLEDINIFTLEDINIFFLEEINIFFLEEINIFSLGEKYIFSLERRIFSLWK